MKYQSAFSKQSHDVCKKTDGTRGCIKQNEPDSEEYTDVFSHILKGVGGNKTKTIRGKEEGWGKGTEERGRVNMVKMHDVCV